jgi:Zn-dependent M28 family amino/carboxypeptidase
MKYLLLSLITFFASCSEKKAPESEKIVLNPTIEAKKIRDHVAILASDEYQGRFPSTIGEEKTIDYLTTEFKKMGIKPANKGSYLQPFEVTEMLSKPDTELKLNFSKAELHFDWQTDYVAQTRRLVDNINIQNAELVFCGYGISAPEYNWNDFEGIDLSDKIAVVFVNDPGFQTQDPELFAGNNMTYYGRWSYKYEEASRQGALGLMIIHEDDAAGYPWEVVRNGWSGTEMVIVDKNKNMSRAAVEGWFSKSKAELIFADAGFKFDELKKKAINPDFKPIPLGVSVSLNIDVETKPTKTHNIVGMIPSVNQSDEYLIYMGHWDHYGIGDAVDGDSILNGARDNASGVAGILEIAEKFVSEKTNTNVNIVIMFTGGEEQGLLGSKYYGSNPLYPLSKTIACINIDGLNIWGAMNDLVQIGRGQSPDLDMLMDKYANKQDRIIIADPEGEKGYFYRSDHFSLAKNGVPAIYTHIGYDLSEKGKEEGERMVKEWTKKYYHKPGDELEDWWNLDGAVDDLQLLYNVGKEMAETNLKPKWSEKSEFYNIRKESLSK